jgi:hypothetical protein
MEPDASSLLFSQEHAHQWARVTWSTQLHSYTASSTDWSSTSLHFLLQNCLSSLPTAFCMRLMFPYSAKFQLISFSFSSEEVYMDAKRKLLLFCSTFTLPNLVPKTLNAFFPAHEMSGWTLYEVTVLQLRIPPSGMWRLVDLVLTDVSEKRVASIFRMGRVLELGTTLRVINCLLVTANVPGSWILSILNMEATHSFETSVITTLTAPHPRRRHYS